MAVEPQLDLEPVIETLCPLWTPIKLTGLILQWLRQHYVTGNIQQTGVQADTWSNSDNTGILIESIGRYRPQNTEKRPALIVKRGKIQVMHDGIGNRFLGGGGVAATRDVYSVRLLGTHTVFCIAGESGECETLAAETYRELIGFAPIMNLKLGLIRMVVAGVGELTKLEEASENFVVPVDLAYAWWDSWEITPNAAVFKSLDFSAGSGS